MRENARDAYAERTGCWLLDHASASDVPGWSRTEIYVGDQLLEIAGIPGLIVE